MRCHLSTTCNTEQTQILSSLDVREFYLVKDVFLDGVRLNFVLALHARGRRERPVTLDNACQADNL